MGYPSPQPPALYYRVRTYLPADYWPKSVEMPTLMAMPPNINHTNSSAASASGLIPAVRTADTCVVAPSAAMAIASSPVSTSTAVLTNACGRTASELSPATATKPRANHGITTRRGRCYARGADASPAG